MVGHHAAENYDSLRELPDLQLFVASLVIDLAMFA
jgi:hypothetical protein